MSLKPSEILSAAADLIEQRGWTQGAQIRDAAGNKRHWSHGGAACFCTLGAIYTASEGRTDVIDPSLALLKASAGLSSRHDIATWNDHRDRTAEEVVSALRQAAEKAREAGQ